VNRRAFITLFGGAAAAWPLVSIAQQRKVPTIGVLVVEAPGSEQFWQLFQKVMRELGDRTKDKEAAFPHWPRSWCGLKSI
jgi:hypothetical protein